MGWFWSRRPEPVPTSEEWGRSPPRLASNEFLAAYREIRDGFLAAANRARDESKHIGIELSAKTYFNYQEADRRFGQMRAAVERAIRYEKLAADLDQDIHRYEHEGMRPSHMPAPPEPAKDASQSGE